MKRWLVALGWLLTTGCAGAGWVRPEGGLGNQSLDYGAECYTDSDCSKGAVCVAHRCSGAVP
jgi:hypothetical protein